MALGLVVGIDPVQVLENSVVAVVNGDRTDQVAELVEQPGELVGLVLAGSILEELDGIVVLLIGDNMFVGVIPDLSLSTLEGLSLGNILNILVLALQTSKLNVVSLGFVDVNENIIVLGIVVAIDIDGLGLALADIGFEDSVVVTINMVVLVDLLGDNAGDLGEIGVNDDQTVAVLDLVELDLLALSADHSLSGGGLVGLSSGALHTVGVGLNDLGGSLLAEVAADVALSGGNIVGSVRSGNDLSIGLAGLGVVPLGGGTAPLILRILGIEVEVLLAQSGLVEFQSLVSHVAESRGIGDGGLLNSTEQDLGNQLTGSGSAEVGGLGNVLQNAELLGILGNVQGPVSAGELTVLVVADSAEDHREDLVAGHVAGRLEGAIGITLDELSVGAVADVALSPTGTGHVAELVVGGVQTGLVVLGDVAGVDTIDDRSHFCTGDVALGLEGTIFITLEHIHAIQNGNGLSVISADVLVILEGTGADGQRQSHDQSQHHCE